MPDHTYEADGHAPADNVEHLHEKAPYGKEDVAVVGEKGSSYSDDKSLETASQDRASDVQYVNGEPVIANGRDVSRFLVDLRDDGDPAITFRSLVLGTLFACLGATLVQVSIMAMSRDCSHS